MYPARMPQDNCLSGTACSACAISAMHTDTPCVADIEDVTSKTGSFKKYGVFIRMLITAVQQTSDSVVVDLLTFADLEELKSRRAATSSAAQKPAGPQAQPALSGLQPSNKRYLILTYAAEFDRVHYPLPLAYEERPDPERLKGLIRQLRLQLTEVRDI